MSIVIVGGHDRMVSQYKQICRNFKCKAKVFTQMSAEFGKQVGSPDLLFCLRTQCPINGAGSCGGSAGNQNGGGALPHQQPERPCGHS